MDERDSSQWTEDDRVRMQADMEAEAEIVAAMLHRTLVGHIGNPNATISGTTSGLFTHMLRHLDAVLSYFVSRGSADQLTRWQAEFLRMLQVVAEQVANVTIDPNISTAGDGKVH